MAKALPAHIWFVRSGRGSGSYPVRPEGWKVVWKFVAGMAGWGLAAALLAGIGVTWGPAWLTVAAPLFFAAGAALSAWNFIATARRHTDYALTYSDYVKDKNDA